MIKEQSGGNAKCIEVLQDSFMSHKRLDNVKHQLQCHGCMLRSIQTAGHWGIVRLLRKN